MRVKICYVVGTGENYGLDFSISVSDGALFIVFPKEVKERIIQ